MDAPSVIRTRVKAILRYYEALGFSEFDAFVSESIGDDGIRAFRSLWLINASATMEALLTEATDDQIDGVPLDRLIRWAIRSREYDFRKAKPESRLNLQLWYTE